MPLGTLLTRPERLATLVAIGCLTGASAFAWTSGEPVRRSPVTRHPAAATPSPAAVNAAPPPPAATPAPSAQAPAPIGSGAPVALVRVERRAVVRAAPAPGARPVSSIGAGILLPAAGARNGFVSVQTPCEIDGWIAEADVRPEPPGSGGGEPGRATAFHEATIVLDAGHGGIAKGAVGRGGLAEKVPNLDIVRRLAALLERPRAIDPGTGAVVEGTTYGTPRTYLTRSGDYDAGLAYRAAIANAARASAFVSVHNNADPDGPLDRPGTETYYQARSPESRRLAGLAYEEVVRALSPFRAAWMGDRDAGAKYRLSTRGGDYYGLLRRSAVPSALVEAAFISNVAEEELLRRPEVTQAVAEALYRALLRFITTDDAGSGFVEPYPRQSGPSGAVPSACTDPA